MANTAKKNLIKDSNKYYKFDLIDGVHPIQQKAPSSAVNYQARQRPKGKVTFFNFELAKEMGIIDINHPEKLNKLLENKILETFSLIIINEYDEINNLKFDKDTIKKNRYMATRYLQIQHPNKQGKTSGDGRSVWNGTISNNGQTWDVSSCGTGATCLSPATSNNCKFYQSGDPSVSYGCGYSEIDEGIAALFFSEIFNKNNFKTERVLALIEFRGGISINIRAHTNLLRPSHFFLY